MEKKKQHYIPVCFLNGFSSNNKFIWVYDRIEGKSFPRSVKDVACEDRLYTINKNLANKSNVHDFDPEFYETKFFAEKIEREYSIILNNLRKNANMWINHPHVTPLSKVERDQLAAHIAIQHLRLPNIQKKYFEAYKETNNKRLEIIKALLINEKPELKSTIERITEIHNPDFSAVVHSWLYADQQLVNEYQDLLLKKTWAFMVSPSKGIYCSDRPIIAIPRIENQKYYYEGLGMKGVEILFPLSSNILLVMWDKEYFDDKNFSENSFQHLSNKYLNINNLYQYLNAERQVYKEDKDFNLIDIIIKNGGKDLRTPKSKINVY